MVEKKKSDSLLELIVITNERIDTNARAIVQLGNKLIATLTELEELIRIQGDLPDPADTEKASKRLHILQGGKNEKRPKGK